MTNLMYLDNLDLFKIDAKISNIGHDEKGSYIILDQTVFYPQGGGQPADLGIMEFENQIINVVDVRFLNNEVRHYIDKTPENLQEGSSVTLILDKDRRIINSKYHTAGHLLSAIVEEYDPNLKGVKGHHFPGEAYVEFSGPMDIDENLLTTLQNGINIALANNLKVQIYNVEPEEIATVFSTLAYELPKNKKIRACKITDYAPVPCGGTHILNISDIDKIILTKIKSKKGQIKISYEL